MAPDAKPAEEPPQDESSETMDVISENGIRPAAAAKKKKKKKKKKNTVERGETALPKNRGSGFELYYADPPCTAAEAEEEAKLYSP